MQNGWRSSFQLQKLTVSVILLTIFDSFPNHYFAERLQVIVEILITKWLGL